MRSWGSDRATGARFVYYFPSLSPSIPCPRAVLHLLHPVAYFPVCPVIINRCVPCDHSPTDETDNLKSSARISR